MGQQAVIYRSTAVGWSVQTPVLEIYSRNTGSSSVQTLIGSDAHINSSMFKREITSSHKATSQGWRLARAFV